MKKTIVLTIIVLLIAGYAMAFSPAINAVISSGGGFTCTTDTSNLVMSQTSTDGASVLSSSNALGQSVSYGSAWYLSQIKLNFGYVETAGTITVRIGSSKDLSTYDEQWASVSVTTEGEITLTSVNHPHYASTAYIGVIAPTGSIYMSVKGSGSSYAGGTWIHAGTGWSMGSDSTDDDAQMKVYKCQ